MAVMPFLYSSFLEDCRDSGGSSERARSGWLQPVGDDLQDLLPMIFNHMQVALMLGLIFLVKRVRPDTDNDRRGPGQKSYTLTYYIYKTLFSGSNVGRAAALSVITVIVTLTVINLIFRAIKNAVQSMSKGGT